MVELFILFCHISNNCKIVCSNNLGKYIIVIAIDFEKHYCAESDIKSVTPRHNFPFVISVITKVKSRKSAKWAHSLLAVSSPTPPSLFFISPSYCSCSVLFWSFSPDLVSNWVITFSGIVHTVTRIITLEAQ